MGQVQGQPRTEFVIGGCQPGNPFDALIVGNYESEGLLYAAKVRNGFVPLIRREVASKFKRLEMDIPKHYRGWALSSVPFWSALNLTLNQRSGVRLSAAHQKYSMVGLRRFGSNGFTYFATTICHYVFSYLSEVGRTVKRHSTGPSASAG